MALGDVHGDAHEGKSVADAPSEVFVTLLGDTLGGSVGDAFAPVVACDVALGDNIGNAYVAMHVQIL